MATKREQYEKLMQERRAAQNAEEIGDLGTLRVAEDPSVYAAGAQDARIAARLKESKGGGTAVGGGALGGAAASAPTVAALGRRLGAQAPAIEMPSDLVKRANDYRSFRSWASEIEQQHEGEGLKDREIDAMAQVPYTQEKYDTIKRVYEEWAGGLKGSDAVQDYFTDTVRDMRAQVKGVMLPGFDERDRVLEQYATSAERETYNHLRALGLKDAAEDYLLAVERAANSRRAAGQDAAKYGFYRNEGGVNVGKDALGVLESSASSLLTGFASIPAQIAQNVGNLITGDHDAVDVNAPAFDAERNVAAVNRALVENAGDLWSVGGSGGRAVGEFAMETLLSVGSNVARMVPAVAAGLMTGGGSVLAQAINMGFAFANSAGQTSYEQLRSGSGNGNALTFGLVAGALECLTEILPIEQLFKLLDGGDVAKLTTKAGLRAVLKQAGVEASEETVNELCAQIADVGINGYSSEFESVVRDGLAKGMTEEQAMAAAWLNALKNVGRSAAAGAISGGVMGTGGILAKGAVTAVSESKERKTGQDLKKDGFGDYVLKSVPDLSDTERAAVQDPVGLARFAAANEDVYQGFVAEKELKRNVADSGDAGRAALGTDPSAVEWTIYEDGRDGASTEEGYLQEKVKASGLSAERVYALYEAGAKDRNAVKQFTVSDSEVGLHFDGAAVKLNRTDARVLNELAKSFSVKLTVADMKENGKIQGDRITVNRALVREGNYMPVVTHETAHRIHDLMSDKAYRDLTQDFYTALEEVGAGAFADSAERAVVALKKDGKIASAQMADELFAYTLEAVGTRLTEDQQREVLKRLAGYQPTGWEKIKTVIAELLEKLRGLVGRVQEVDGLYQAMLKLADRMREVAKESQERTKNTANAGENEKTAEGGGERHSINPNYWKEFDAWVANGKPQRGKLTLGATSEPLREIGIRDAKIIFDTSKINKIQKDHPNMTDKVLRNLPYLLEHPVLIMDSKTEVDRIVLFGSLRDNSGAPVLCALELKPTDKQGVYQADIIKVASAYGKDHGLQRLLDTSDIRWVTPNKNRINAWLVRNRLQLPFHQYDIDSNNSIPENGENVNTRNSEISVKRSPDEGIAAQDPKKTASEDGTVRFSLPEFSLKEQLEDFGRTEKTGAYNGQYFDLGTTPDILVKYGAKKRQLIMTENCVLKATGGKHEVAMDTLAEIPEQLEDPFLIYKGSSPKSFAVFSDITDKRGDPVLIAVHLDREQDRMIVNSIVSSYGKEGFLNYIETQIELGNLLYVNTKKEPDWFTSSWLQLPQLVQTISDSTNSIAQNSQNVNSDNSENSVKRSSDAGIAAQIAASAETRKAVEGLADTVKGLTDGEIKRHVMQGLVALEKEYNVDRGTDTTDLYDRMEALLRQMRDDAVAGAYDTETVLQTVAELTDEFLSELARRENLNVTGFVGKVKGMRLGLDEKQAADVAYVFGSLKEARQAVFPFCSLTTKGKIKIDALYNALRKDFPDLPEWTGAAEALTVIRDRIRDEAYYVPWTALSETDYESAAARMLDGMVRGNPETARTAMNRLIRSGRGAVEELELQRMSEELKQKKKLLKKADKAKHGELLRRTMFAQLKNKLKSMVAPVTNRNPIPEKLRALNQAVGNAFLNFELKIHGDDLDRIALEIKEAFPEETDAPKDGTAEALLTQLEKVRVAAQDRSMEELGLEALQILLDFVSMVRHRIVHANEVFVNGRRETVEKAAQKAMESIRSNALKSKKAESLFKAMGETGLMTPETVFKLFGMEEWFASFTEAERDYVAKLMVARARLTDALGGKDAPKNIKRMEEDVRVLRLRSGDTVALSVLELMTLYLGGKREEYRYHLLHGGFTLHQAGDTKTEREQARDQKKMGKEHPALREAFRQMEIHRGNPYHVTEEDLKAVSSLLSEEERNMAKALGTFMAEDCAEWGNLTSQKVDGFRKFTDPNYIPIETDAELRKHGAVSKEAMAAVRTQTKLKNTGFTKPLQPNSAAVVSIRSLLDVTLHHADEMARYAAYAGVLDDFDRVMRYSDGQTSVRKTMTNVYRNRWITGYLDELYHSLNGNAAAMHYGMKFWETVSRHIRGAAIAYNISSVAKQLASYPRAMAELSAGSLVRAVGARVHSHEWMMEHVPYYAMKAEMAGYDVSFGHDLEEMVRGGKTKLLERVQDAGFWGMEQADLLAWRHLYRACEFEVRKQDPRLSEKERTDAVNARFHAVIDRTQVVDSPLHRTALQRGQHGNVIAYMYYPYSSEPQKTANLLAQAVLDHQRGEKGKAVRAVVSVALSALLSSLIGAAFSNLRAPDDQDEDEFLQNAASNFVSELVNVIPLAESLLEMGTAVVLGEASFTDDDLLSLVLDLAKIPWKIWDKLNGTDDGKQDTSTGWLNLGKFVLRTLSTAFGVGVYNGVKDAVNVLDGIARFSPGWNRYRFYKAKMFYNVKNPSERKYFYDALYGAKQDGDLRTYNEIYSYLTYHGVTASAIKSALAARGKE